MINANILYCPDRTPANLTLYRCQQANLPGMNDDVSTVFVSDDISSLSL